MQDLSSADPLRPVLAFLQGHPGVVPTILVLAVLAWWASGPLSRHLGRERFPVGLLVLSATAPFAMTLAPNPDVGYPFRWCITDVRPVSDWGRGGEELANIFMLAPFAFLVLVLLTRRSAALVLLLASVFPFAVELVQYAVPRLGRSCETTDVVLNLTGLLVGALAGLPVRLLMGRDRHERVEV